MRILLLTMGLLVWTGAGDVRALGEEPAQLTPLKLEIVLSQHQEGKEATRIPYALYVVANADYPTELRTGREVPLPVTSFVSPTGEARSGLGSVPVTSFQYRNVGMNVSCRARSHEERFRIKLELERSSLYESEEPDASSSSQPASHPSFRTFNSSNELLLRLTAREVLRAWETSILRSFQRGVAMPSCDGYCPAVKQMF